MIDRPDPRRGNGYMGSLSFKELLPHDQEAIVKERGQNNVRRRMTDRRTTEESDQRRREP